jgi:hypothetical protein
MAVGTLGTLSTTALAAITFGTAGATTSGTAHTVSPADLAAIANSIVGDARFAATNPNGILATGTTHTNTTLDTLVAVAGGALATAQVGDLVLGVNASSGALVIPVGTFITAFGNAGKTSLTLSQAATASAASMKIAIIPAQGISSRLSFNQQLEVPGRGILKVLPGDVVAVDSTGWPILVSAASIAYAGTQWSKA